MEEPTQVELLIRALRGVIRKFSSDNPTDYSPSNRDKSHDTCYICKEKGHWATECPDRNKKRLKETKVKTLVIIVKRKDIGLQTVLRNNRNRRGRILNRRRKRCPPSKKKFDTFTKTRKEDETTVRKKMKNQ